MNGDDNEYRRQAADAERQARSAKNDLDRASWLRIAQGWLSLLRRRPQSDEEAFVPGRTIPNPRIKAASVGGPLVNYPVDSVGH